MRNGFAMVRTRLILDRAIEYEYCVSVMISKASIEQLIRGKLGDIHLRLKRLNYISWIKPRTSKPHDISLEKYCEARNIALTKSGTANCYWALTQNGELLIISCREKAKHKLRARTETIFALIEYAIANNKFYLCRYDPDNLLQDAFFISDENPRIDPESKNQGPFFA